MESMTAVRIWKELENYISLIKDPFVANAFRHELEKKAYKDWGFCPTGFKDTEEENLDDILSELTDDERTLYEHIQTYLEYGVDIMTEEEKHKIDTKTLNNMIDFIEKGHTYWEIPEDIRCDSLKEIYDKAFDIVFDVEKFTKTA